MPAVHPQSNYEATHYIDHAGSAIRASGVFDSLSFQLTGSFD
jgi:hypothetical protein